MVNKNTNEIVIIVTIVVILFILFGGFGMMGFGWYGMHSMMNWFYPGFGIMWIFMLLVPILVITALVLFIVWLIKQLQEGGRK